MKTAKEMFEELGYEELNTNYTVLLKIYARKVDRELDKVAFTPNKTVMFTDYRGCMDMSLLAAINKQVEELGWNEGE